MTQIIQVDHLTAHVRSRLNRSIDERIKDIQALTYVPYPKAEYVLSLMHRLCSEPMSGRPRGLTISAVSGNGKTTITNTFLYKHPMRETTEARIIPVLKVEAPPVPSEKRILGGILNGFSSGDAIEAGDVETRMRRIKILVHRCQVKLMVLDESNNLLAGTARAMEECCNVLKYLSNQLGIRIVLVGTKRVENVLRSDPQLLSRFPIVELPLWKDGRCYRRFLEMLESALPLANASDLASDEKAFALLEHSHGVLGDIVMTVKDAAICALRNHEERITTDILKCPFSVLKKSR